MADITVGHGRFDSYPNIESHPLATAEEAQRRYHEPRTITRIPAQYCYDCEQEGVETPLTRGYGVMRIGESVRALCMAHYESRHA